MMNIKKILKKFSIVFLSTFIFGAISCSNNETLKTTKPNTQSNTNITLPKEELTTEGSRVLDLLNGLNISMLNSKQGYTATFNHKYNVSYKKDTKIESSEFSMNYEASGSTSLVIKFNNQSNINDEIKWNDLLSYANGYLKTSSNEKFIHHYKSIDKTDNNKISEINDNIGFNNQVSIKIDDNTLYTSSSWAYDDLSDSNNDSYDSFSAKIDRALIKDSLSDMMLSNTMNKIMYMEVWDYIDNIINFSNYYLTKLDFNNAKSLNDFAKNNQVSLEDNTDKLTINYSINLNELMTSLYDITYSRNPIINGFVTIDKTTKIVKSFKYDLSEYFLAILEKDKDTLTDFVANVDTFIVEGNELNEIPASLDMQINYTNYDNLDTFVDDFSNRVVIKYKELI